MFLRMVGEYGPCTFHTYEKIAYKGLGVYIKSGSACIFLSILYFWRVQKALSFDVYTFMKSFVIMAIYGKIQMAPLCILKILVH